MATMLHEQSVNVFYSFEPQEGLKKFEYICKHIPTNKMIDRVVYCFNGKDYMKLVFRWDQLGNCQPVREWEYFIVDK